MQPHRLLRYLLLPAAVFLAPTAATAVLTYTVTDLGPLTELSGRSDSKPYDINDNGQIALTNVVSGAYRGLRYGSPAINLGTLGGNESLAFGVNSAGQVVGRSDLVSSGTHAFLWTPGGTDGVPGNPQMKDLGTLGGSNSEADSINSSGQITGYAQSRDRSYHAFRYSGTTMTDLHTALPSGYHHSYGLDINAAGNVTGYAQGGTRMLAFLYDGNGMIDLGGLGGYQVVAVSINDFDRVAGYSARADDTEHAFLYDGTMKDLGTLGGNYSYALSINNSNVVVGGSFIDPDDTAYHAFVYSRGPLVDLNTRLDGSGAGWELIEATAINGGGQIIGTGRLSGQNHGFLLTPNVYSTLAITGQATQTFSVATATYAQPIADSDQAVSVVKDGPGVVVLSGPNTYTGSTAISDGTLSVASMVADGGVSNLGNGASPVVLGSAASPGALQYTGPAATFTRGFTIHAGGGEINHTGSGALTIAEGDIAGGAGGALIIDGSGDVTVDSDVVLGAGRLIKYGTGTLTLRGAGNLFAGTSVEEGTLWVSNVHALPAGAPLAIASGASVVLSSGLSVAAAGGAGGAVPEPGSLALLAVSVAAGLLVGLRRRARVGRGPEAEDVR